MRVPSTERKSWMHAAYVEVTTRHVVSQLSTYVGGARTALAVPGCCLKDSLLGQSRVQ